MGLQWSEDLLSACRRTSLHSFLECPAYQLKTIVRQCYCYVNPF